VPIKAFDMETGFSLHPGLDAAGVWSRLPKRYRTMVATAALGAGPIDLLVFEAGEGHVVDSDDLAKALGGIESPSTQIAVIGYDFTDEARARVRSLGGFLFAEQNVGDWTDGR
jgi:hypothetical protein